VLGCQTMTPTLSVTGRRGLPVDSILHALSASLTEASKSISCDGLSHLSKTEHEEATRLLDLAWAITRATNPATLAEEWANPGDIAEAAAHLCRRLTNPGGTPLDPSTTSNAEGRALEIAVARRLADTACCLVITGDKEDDAQASALWKAAGALAGHTKSPQTIKVSNVTMTIGGQRISGFAGDHYSAGHRPGAEWPTATEEAASTHTLELVRAALAVPGTEDIVAHARKVIAERNDLRGTIDTVWPIIGTRENFAAGVRLLKQRADECDTITAQRNGANDVAARRLAIIMQHDEQDLRIREALGAENGEATIDAAKRVADGYSAYKTAHADLCRQLRDGQHEAAMRLIAERDAAIEARAQMQARLVAVEKERDAAQEEARQLRGKVAEVNTKRRPMPGDRVPWEEVEDGCLYFDGGERDAEWARFVGVFGGRQAWVAWEHQVKELIDGDTCRRVSNTTATDAILVARDLGTDPEAWRKAMREWAQNGKV